MLKRILGLLGWLGVALVFAAVAIRFAQAGVAAVLQRRWRSAGLVCTLLYILSQWREIGAGRSRDGRRATARSRPPASLVVLGILVAINYLGDAAEQALGPDATSSSRCRTRRKKVLQDLKEPVQIRVFARSDEFQRFRDRLDEYTYASKQVTVEYIDPDKKPALAQQYGVTALGTVVFDYKGRTEKVDVRRRAGPHQRADQGRPGTAAEGLLHRRATARRTPTSARPRRLQRDRRRARPRELRRRQAGARAAERGARRRRRRRRRGAEDRLPRAGDRRAEDVPRARAASCWSCSIRVTRPDSRSSPTSGAAQGLGHRASATTSSSTSAAWGG